MVRAPWGGGVHGALYHSQSIEATYAHIPGLKVVVPSTPADVAGLLREAIDDPDPVLFLEHKKTYRLIKGEVPDDSCWRVPIGVAAIARAGTDATVVTYGLHRHSAVEAADRLAAEGVGDGRGRSTCARSRRSTSTPSSNRCAAPAAASWSTRTTAASASGAEVAAVVAEEAFYDLDAPVRRLCHRRTSRASPSPRRSRPSCRSARTRSRARSARCSTLERAPARARSCKMGEMEAGRVARISHVGRTLEVREGGELHLGRGSTSDVVVGAAGPAASPRTSASPGRPRPSRCATAGSGSATTRPASRCTSCPRPAPPGCSRARTRSPRCPATRSRSSSAAASAPTRCRWSCIGSSPTSEPATSAAMVDGTATQYLLEFTPAERRILTAALRAAARRPRRQGQAGLVRPGGRTGLPVPQPGGELRRRPGEEVRGGRRAEPRGARGQGPPLPVRRALRLDRPGRPPRPGGLSTQTRFSAVGLDPRHDRRRAVRGGRPRRHRHPQPARGPQRAVRRAAAGAAGGDRAGRRRPRRRRGHPHRRRPRLLRRARPQGARLRRARRRARPPAATARGRARSRRSPSR